MDNAAEALEHSLQKEIWVRTALNSEHDVAEITVADSGPGIAPEDKEKLFLPFFSTKHRGTGLGLAIVSRIVTEQKGVIRVEENAAHRHQIHHRTARRTRPRRARAVGGWQQAVDGANQNVSRKRPYRALCPVPPYCLQ